MSNIKISTIIPVYNVEKYIEETLNSIINQTLNNIEIILIDDGSTDNSPKILDQYAEKYPNIKVTHTPNQGQATARNIGLKQAQGEYITFLDSDDKIPPQAYEKLYQYSQETEQEIVIGNILRFNEKKIFPSLLYQHAFPKKIQKTPSTNIKQQPTLIYDTGIWNKIIKKSFLDKHNLKFYEGVFYEDLLFTIKLHYLTPTIAIIPDTVYYWRMREEENSTSQKLTKIKNLNDRFTIINEIYKFINKNKINDELLEAQYTKWLKHDIMLFINEYLDADTEFQKQLITKTNKLLNKIPQNITKQLNLINQLKYKLILKKHHKLLLILLKTLKYTLFIRKTFHR